MSTCRSGDVERLHHVLLRGLADQHGAPLTTAELRRRAERELAIVSGAPVVIEAVYRALRTLHRRGQVAHHRPDGRHAQWSLTPTGAAAAARPVDVRVDQATEPL